MGITGMLSIFAGQSYYELLRYCHFEGFIEPVTGTIYLST